jgi:hypothetical protein
MTALTTDGATDGAKDGATDGTTDAVPVHLCALLRSLQFALL